MSARTGFTDARRTRFSRDRTCSSFNRTRFSPGRTRCNRGLPRDRRRACITAIGVAFAGCAFAAAAALGCDSRAHELPAPLPAAAAPRPSAPAALVPARPPRDVALLEAPATVEAAPEAAGAVTPPYAARVVRIHVRAGEHVDKGAAVVDVVMPELVRAAGAYAAARTRLDAYGRRRTQLEGLRAEGLARVAELAEVETRQAEARADQQAALATLRAAGAGPDDAARILDGGGAVALRSPVSGTVIALDAVLGETRDANGRPLVRVVGASAPRVMARVAHRLPPRARFELVTASGERLPLELLAQAPVVDARDGTTASWFQPPAGARVPGGVSGRVRILLPDDTKAVVVPAAAVLGDRATPLVFVRAGDSLKRVPVRLLASSGADALVEGALAAGDVVAADASAVAATDAGAAGPAGGAAP